MISPPHRYYKLLRLPERHNISYGFLISFGILLAFGCHLSGSPMVPTIYPSTRAFLSHPGQANDCLHTLLHH